MINQSKTHRVGGLLGGLVGYTLLKQGNLLMKDVFGLSLLIITYFSSLYGTCIPELSHRNWCDIPYKGILSWLLWKIFSLPVTIIALIQQNRGKSSIKTATNLNIDSGKWVTHSDIFLCLSMVVIFNLLSFKPNSIDSCLLISICVGLLCGVVSHLLVDVLSGDGIYSLLLFARRVLNKGKGEVKFKFQPKGINSKVWRNIVTYLIIFLSIFLLIRLVYLCQPYRIVLSFG